MQQIWCRTFQLTNKSILLKIFFTMLYCLHLLIKTNCQIHFSFVCSDSTFVIKMPTWRYYSQWYSQYELQIIANSDFYTIFPPMVRFLFKFNTVWYSVDLQSLSISLSDNINIILLSFFYQWFTLAILFAIFLFVFRSLFISTISSFLSSLL